MRNIFVIVGVVFTASACGGSHEAPDAPTKTESEGSGESAGEPPAGPSNEPPERPQLTAEQCESGGGSVVGDIGDGAVHRPDYRCASGAVPTGSIVAPAGGPMGVEGAVCCPK